ncbi:MAG: hypothetical protein GXY36_17405 [Chloroflexi bacterium]|nr:hypothetical protein [Chloroflexota bacterium]
MLRRVVGALALAVVVFGTVSYVVYAANGILDETQARERREQHDDVIVHTATAIAARLTQGGDDLEPPPGDAGGDAALQATEALEAALPTVDAPMQDSATLASASLPEPTAIAQAASETPTTEPTQPPTATETPLPTATEPPSPTTVQATVTLIPTNTPRVTVTLIPTNTQRPSITPLPTDTLPPTVTFTASPTLTPSLTPTPSPTPTPSITPSPTYIIEGTYAVPVNTPVVALPERVPLMEDSDQIVNILLLGSDTTSSALGQTDVIIVLSINKEANSAAMWHLPRDLFVYIPNYTMDRVNRAYALGEMNDYPGGGFGLMKETFLYNFGIKLDHYARVDFSDFMRIVQELGGLDVSVDCSIRDWRLIDPENPEMDPTLEESWEMYTLPLGRQTLSPYMALWYVRSRVTTSDLDRGRRQMDALRAMWQQALRQGLFTQVTQLWPEAVEVVETDMALTDVLGFVPLAVSLDPSNIARYSGTRGVHYTPFLTPDDGRDVMLPNYEQLIPLIRDFLTPPTENRMNRQSMTVDIVDASGYYIGFDLVAADRLAWEGFAGRALGMPEGVPRRDLTVIYDYTGQSKGSVLEDLMRVLRVSDEQVIVQPDPNRTVDFRVEIGSAYNSCVLGNAEDEIETGPPVDEAAPVDTTAQPAE